MKRTDQYLRIIGACVVLALAVNYQLFLYSLETFSTLWSADAALPAIFMGVVQVLSWPVLLVGGGLLLIPMGMGKWVLFGSLLLSLVGGVFIAWLPGANYIGEVLSSPRLSLALFAVLNVGMLVLVFRFTREAT